MQQDISYGLKVDITTSIFAVLCLVHEIAFCVFGDLCENLDTALYVSFLHLLIEISRFAQLTGEPLLYLGIRYAAITYAFFMGCAVPWFNSVISLCAFTNFLIYGMMEFVPFNISMWRYIASENVRATELVEVAYSMLRG